MQNQIMPYENRYSPRWKSTFLKSVPEWLTHREIDFIRAWYPQPRSQLLDLACGTGRHSLALSAAGYAVTGIEQDVEVIRLARDKANHSGLDAEFVEGDIYTLNLGKGIFDGVLSLWQSFGYSTHERNMELLGKISHCLKNGAYLIADLYHSDFFLNHEGSQMINREGAQIREEKFVVDGRLHLSLSYMDTGEVNYFNWEVFTPKSFAEYAAPFGLELVKACAGFDLQENASAINPRMQLVLQKNI